MVSKANRRLAETEEELRIAMAQKEALRGALQIVEGENGALRGVGSSEHDASWRKGKGTANEEDKQQLTGIDAEQAQGNEFRNSIRSKREDKTDVSYNELQQPSQSLHAPLHNAKHLALSSHPDFRSIPTTVTAQRPVATDKGSVWTSVTPSSDSGEAEERDTPTLSSHSLVSSSQTPPVRTSSIASTTHSLNPDAFAPTSTTQLTQADTHATPIHRWSVLPATRSSRIVVRSEFEDAMRRMRELVGEEENSGVDDDAEEVKEGECIVEGEHSGVKEGDDVKAKRENRVLDPWRT